MKYIISFLIFITFIVKSIAHPSIISLYNFSLPNILEIDGDSVTYENEYIKAYVDKYANSTKMKRSGKEKKNRKYQSEFAALVATLEASKMVFNFTDNGELITDKNTVGLVVPRAEGTIDIIVPEYAPSTEKGKLQSIMGGRSNLLAEETFHAVQISKGEIIPEKNGFIRGSKTLIAAEVEAKIFAANSAMSKLSSSIFKPGYTVPTIAKLIRGMDVNKLKVLQVIVNGGIGVATRRQITGTFAVTYPSSYPSSYHDYN